MPRYLSHLPSTLALIGAAAIWGTGLTGCTAGDRQNEPNGPATARQVVVVAPVLNLSGTTDFDPLRFTDLLASEFLSFSTVSVVPVNLTLATLAEQGRAWVETPEDALELARALGADATVVTAVTEYDPYDPPVIGLVMQWYALPGATAAPRLDPVAASRRSTDPVGAELSAYEENAPRFQLQRVFDASHDQVLREIQQYARGREGHHSPYGFRKHVKSQELYIRYCCWSLIKPMLTLSRHGESGVMPTEVEP